MTKIAHFPVPERPSTPLCTCPGRDADRRRDGETALEDLIAMPWADHEIWLIACPNCNGTTAQQRREALALALAAVATAEQAVITARGARSRALAAVDRANQIAANARLFGSPDGLPPRLTVPPDI